MKKLIAILFASVSIASARDTLIETTWSYPTNGIDKGFGFYVYQRNHIWYVSVAGDPNDRAFTDGMTFRLESA